MTGLFSMVGKIVSCTFLITQTVNVLQSHLRTCQVLRYHLITHISPMYQSPICWQITADKTHSHYSACFPLIQAEGHCEAARLRRTIQSDLILSTEHRWYNSLPKWKHKRARWSLHDMLQDLFVYQDFVSAFQPRSSVTHEKVWLMRVYLRCFFPSGVTFAALSVRD